MDPTGKPSKEKKEKPSSIEKPAVGEELLGMLLEYGRLDKRGVADKLKVSPEVVDEWIDSLEKEGWIKTEFKETGNPQMDVTESALRRVKKLRDEIMEEGRREEETERRRAEDLGKDENKKTLKPAKFLTENKMDLLIVSATLVTIYLLKRFASNPNQETISFLGAMISFSIALFTYNRYRQKLRIRNTVAFAKEIVKKVKGEKKFVATIIASILLIYFTGQVLFNPFDRIINLYAGVLTLSTVVLIHYPKKDLKKTIGFYAGMSILLYSLLLLVGMTSITEKFLESRRWWADALTAFLLMAVLQMKEDIFGIGVESMREMTEVRGANEERANELPKKQNEELI